MSLWRRRGLSPRRARFNPRPVHEKYERGSEIGCPPSIIHSFTHSSSKPSIPFVHSSPMLYISKAKFKIRNVRIRRAQARSHNVYTDLAIPTA